MFPNQSAATDDSSPVPPLRRRRWLRWAIAALAGVFLYILFLPRPPIANSVLSTTTDDNGNVVTTGDVSSTGGPVAHAVAIKSNVSTFTTSSTARSGGAMWPKATLAIFCESDHMLMQRIGLALFDGLRETNQFDKVHYVPRGKSLPAGEEVPDVLITIEMPSLKETGIQPIVSYDTRFTAIVGRHLLRSNSYSSSNGDPPIVQYQAEMTLEYKADQRGVETSGARYSSVSTDVAKHLKKHLLDFLEKADGEPQPARDVLRDFYPAFKPAPRLAALDTLKATPKFEGPRFMLATDAAWRLETHAGPEEIKQLFEKDLPEPGWKLKGYDPNAATFSGSWINGEELWTIIPVKDNGVVNAEETRAVDQPASPKSYVLTYMHNMSRQAVAMAFRDLLDRQPTEGALLLFRDSWHDERARLTQHFADHPPRSAATLEVLARWKLNGGDQEGARELVLRGWAIDRLVSNGQNKSALEKLAKDCGIEQLPKEFDVAIFAELGLPDFRSVGEMSLTASAGDDLLILLAGHKDMFRTLVLKVRRSANGQWLLGHEVSEIRQGSSSRGSSGPMPIDPTKPNSQWIGHWSANVSVTPFATDNPETLGMRLGRSPQ